MKLNIQKGEKVTHKAREQWGVGEVVSVQRCGTIRVIFEGNRPMSIAKGANFLKRVSSNKKQLDQRGRVSVNERLLK